MTSLTWKKPQSFRTLSLSPPTHLLKPLLSLSNLNLFKQSLQTLPSSLYSSLLQLCADSYAEKHARCLHNHLSTNGFLPDLHTSTKFITAYSKFGDLGAARKTFDEMPQRNVVSWTALISGYCRNGRPKEALAVFMEMRRSGFDANEFTYGSVLAACVGMRCIEGGRQIHCCVEKSKLCGNLIVQSALVDQYSKCGDIEDARGVFKRMSKRDVICWNVVIGGYSVQGIGADALAMFRLMLRDGYL